MATTLVLTPLFPVENESVALTITGSTQDTFVFEITAVPPLSAIPTGFITKPLNVDNTVIAQSNAQAVADGDLIGNSFTPDVGGEYSITVYEFRETVGFAQGHDADPNADARFDLKATTDFNNSAGVVVGVNMDLPIQTIGDDAITLRLNVSDVTVRVASLVSSTTEKARVAALQTSVTTPLAALAGVAVSTIGADLQTEVSDLKDTYTAHINQIAAPDVHQVIDAVNVIKEVDAQSIAGAIELLNEIREALSGHLLTSSVQLTGARWHTIGAGVEADDLKNVPIVDQANTLAESTVLLSELRFRVYDTHRVQDNDTAGEAPVHDVADTTNTLGSTATKLDDTIVAYLDAIADATPTAPTGESQGAADLAHRFGFKRFTIAVT